MRTFEKISVAYAVSAAIWVLVSFVALPEIVTDDALIAKAHMINVFLFIGLTSLFLYVLLKRLVTRFGEQGEALQRSEERWKFALEGAGEGVWDVDIPTGRAHYSRRWKEMLGYNDDEIGDSRDEWRSRVHPDDMAAIKDQMRAYMDGITDEYRSEYRLRCKDGSWKWILARGMVIARSADGKPARLIGTHSDITDIKHVSEALRESSELARLITDNIGDLVALLDPEGRRIYNSPSYRNFFHDDELKKGSSSFSEIHPDDRGRIEAIFLDTVSTGIGHRAEFRFVLKDGSIRYIESQGNVIHDSAGRVAMVLVVSRDITERKLVEQDLRDQARIDFLTGAFNRRYFMEQAEIEVARAVRYGNPLSVLMMDLDHFKQINDTKGHCAGDRALVDLSALWKKTLREMDLIARVGGEEFACLLPETDGVRAAEVAERIRYASANNPIPIDSGESLHVTVSIGIATLDGNRNAGIDALLKEADAALYKAKEMGRNRICGHPLDFSETEL